MVDERAQRLVAVEADAVQVVRLALGPLRGGREVDDARHAPVAHGDALELRAPRRARTAPRARRLRRRRVLA